MTRPAFHRALLVLFAGLLLARVALAWVLPVTEDEAYYAQWGRALDWGYYDHPPGVAWLAATARLAWGSPLAARLGPLLAAAAAFPFAVGLLRRCCPARRAALAGVMLATGAVYPLAAGVLLLPDALLLAAWCAALHEAAAALDGRPRRWITAGLATGAGLLAKYTMGLMAPVLLWALLRGRPRDLRGPWPWLGAAAAVLVFLPHLAWNARHDWVPVRVQLRHGFADRALDDPGASASPLPAPFESAAFDPARTLEFAGGQLLMWGAFAVPIVHFLLRWARRGDLEIGAGPALRPLLVAATWVPLGFFGLVNLFAGVEANWAALHVVAAAGLLAGFFASRLRSAALCVVINAAILLAVAALPRLPVTRFGVTRVHEETRGWPELAAAVAARGGPVLADSHQALAQILYYAPQLEAAQWPGLGRPSEFLRRPEWNRLAADDLAGGFTLVTAGARPPRLPGYTATSTSELHACLDGAAGPSPCGDGQTVHRWLLVTYRPAPGAPGPDPGVTSSGTSTAPSPRE